MNALKNIFASEHGLMAVLLIIGSTTLAAIGVMTVDDWKSYTQVIFAAFAGTHAVITAAGSFASRPVPQGNRTIAVASSPAPAKITIPEREPEPPAGS